LGGDYFLLGGLVLVFLVMMYGLAKDTNETLNKFLSIKSENLDLASNFEKSAKVANRANAAKTRFLAQANHDLRQPVHAIGLLAESLRSYPQEPKAKEILETIDLSVDSLSKLFKSLLNISTLDSGGIKKEICDFALSDLLQQVVRQATPEAEKNKCSLILVPTTCFVRTAKAL